MGKIKEKSFKTGKNEMKRNFTRFGVGKTNFHKPPNIQKILKNTFYMQHFLDD